MTSPSFYDIKCSNCGHTFVISDWTSTNSFGSPDLDSRPAEDYRSTLNQILVKKCTNCGYCNYNIEEAPDNIELIIKSENYKKHLNDNQFPEKAREFLCKSIILESIYDIEEAAWASLHAAWNCDDNDKYVQSKYCRVRAIDLFQIAKSSIEMKFEKNGEYPILLIDLLRRTEQFEKAKIICNIRIQIEDDELLKKIILYQINLIELKDIKGYNTDEALKYYEENIQEDDADSFEDDDDDDDYYYDSLSEDNDIDRDYFDAMTDGQLGDYDDFEGNNDDIETWSRG